MDSDNSIREEGAESTAPEEVMTSEFPPQEEPAAPQEAGSREPDSGSGYSEDPGSDTPAGGGYSSVADGAPGSGGYSSVADDGPGSEPPVNKKSFIRACGSWTDILPIAALLSVILLFFGSIITALVNKLIPVQELGLRLLGDEDGAAFLLQYFDFIGIWILFMLVIAVPCGKLISTTGTETTSRRC